MKRLDSVEYLISPTGGSIYSRQTLQRSLSSDKRNHFRVPHKQVNKA